MLLTLVIGSLLHKDVADFFLWSKHYKFFHNVLSKIQNIQLFSTTE